MKQSELKRLAWERRRSRLLDGRVHVVTDRALLKRALLAHLERAIDQKLRTLRVGQALGIEFRLDVVNSDLSLRGEPSERHAPEARAWRREVFARDNYRCRRCGAGGKLQAHHLRSWVEAPDLRFDTDNGITLCVDCHAAEHPERQALIKKARYHQPR